MYARIDFPALDIIESSEDAQVRVFEFVDNDEDQGIKIVIGEAVVLIHPVRELALKILEVTDGTDRGNPEITG